MIILPEQRVIVVATPRTGSRSIRDAIREAAPPGMVETKPHHDWPKDVRAAAGNGSYEVWTIIRDPWTQLESWSHHTGYHYNIERMVRDYRGRYFFSEGGMNIYNKVVDRYFVFEHDGHQGLIDALGLDVEVTNEYKSKPNEVVWSEAARNIAAERFALDFYLYQKELEKCLEIKETSDSE